MSIQLFPPISQRESKLLVLIPTRLINNNNLFITKYLNNISILVKLVFFASLLNSKQNNENLQREKKKNQVFPISLLTRKVIFISV